MRKALTTILAFALATVFAAPLPAQAVAAGTVTIVATGGSAEGINWTYSNNTIEPSASVSINASDVVAKLANGPLTILGDKILVNSSIVYTNANALIFKPTGTILVNGGVTIQSQGGNLVFNADSDANSTGFVRFGLGTVRTAGAINSNGGNIVVGGGLDAATGFAYASTLDGPVGVDATACVGGTPPVAGIGIYGFAFNSGSGNIRMNGSTSATGSRGFNIAPCTWAGGAITFVASGSGSIYLNGDGTYSTVNPWGIAAGAISITTQFGDITLEGKGGSSIANSRGMSIGGTSSFVSTSGNIYFKDTTNGAAASDYRGVNIGASITITTGGAFYLETDEIYSTGTLIFDVASATIQPFTTSQFNDTITLGAVNATNADSLTIGEPGNTAAIVLNSAISAGGPINLIGGAISVNAALSSPTDITINASGNVTQTAAITASGLALAGTGSFTLDNASNNITTLATGNITSLTFADSNGFSVGTVGSITGVNAAAAPSFSVAGTASYRITFNTQGGSPAADQIFQSGGSVTLPSAPTKAGHSFRGWYTAANGGSPLASNYTPGVNQDIVLFAQWSVTPPPVNLGGLTFTGTEFKLTGSNLDRISELKVNGKPITLVQNPDKSLGFNTSTLAPGSYTLELAGEGVKVTWENAIIIKPAPPVREVTTSSPLPSFTSNSTKLSTEQKVAIKSLVKNATALTCVAGVSAKATASQKRVALAQAQSACNYAKSNSTTLVPSRVQAVISSSESKNSVTFAVTKK